MFGKETMKSNVPLNRAEAWFVLLNSIPPPPREIHWGWECTEGQVGMSLYEIITSSKSDIVL